MLPHRLTGFSVTPRASSLGEVARAARAGGGNAAFGNPTPKTYQQIRDHCSFDQSAPSMVLGYTQHPHGYSAPVFDVEVKFDSRFPYPYGYLVLYPLANEGSLDCIYLAAGEHDSGGTYQQRPVYLRVTEAISARACAAEREHVMDHRYAYTQTLVRAQNAIETIAQERVYAETPELLDTSEEIAYALISDQLQQKLKEALGDELGTTDTSWKARYDTVAKRTVERDTQGWHNMSLGGLVDTKQSDNLPLRWVREAAAGDSRINEGNPGADSADVLDI